MNQDQRKFLIERVNKTYTSQSEELEKKVPKYPSLNNYLVAAFLDDSVKFQPIASLKAKVKDMVLQFGSGDLLVKTEDNSRRFHRGRYFGSGEESVNTVELRAEDIFVVPAAYTASLKEYQAKKDAIEAEMKVLEAARDTILLKIQIGSNEVLDRLVTQVDNMADLNIMNTQLLLTDGKEGNKK